MNNDNLAFVVKILMWSFGISVALKYFGSLFPIPALPIVALIPVLGIPLSVALFLQWQSLQQDSRGW